MKSLFYLPAFLLVFALQVNASKIGSKPANEPVVTMTEGEKKARLEEIQLRIKEIKGMDKSNLTRKERKELRHELKDMKQEAAANRGVYLSIGAIIIIILLLILIL